MPSASIAGCDSTTFQISFTPTTLGLCTANVVIANTDGDENPYLFSISGEGIAFTPSIVEDTINISGGEVNLQLNSNGQIQHTYNISSFDHHLKFSIPFGTTITDGQNNPVDTITITTVINPPAPPAGVNFIGPVFDLGPDGTNFNPPLVLTFSYNDADVPAGVDEGSLKVCFYNESTGQWVECVCTVDIVNNVITAIITHFSEYAIIPHSPPASFTVSNLTIKQNNSGDQATVLVFVDVANTSAASGAYALTLKLNGIVTDTKNISLAGGAVETVSFVLDNQSTGFYVVEVNGLINSYEIGSRAVIKTATTPADPITAAPQITAPTNSSLITVAAAPDKLSGSWIYVTIIGAGQVLLLIIWRATKKAR